MGNLPGIGNVNASSANTSIGFAGSAVAALEAGFAPRPYVYVGGTSLIKDLRQIKAGTSYDAPLFPPTSEDLPALYGASGYLAPAITAGTCYFYWPSSCFVATACPTSRSRSTGRGCSIQTAARCGSECGWTTSSPTRRRSAAALRSPDF